MLKSLPVGDPVAALSHRRRRQLLRAGRPAGPLGDVLVPALRAPQGRGARVRAADRLPGRHGPHGRAPPGRRRRAAAAARHLRHRQLLHDAGRQRVRRPGVHRPPTTRPRPRRWSCWPITPGRGVYGGDPAVVGATLVIEGQPSPWPGSRRPASSARRSRPIRPTCGCRCSRSRSSPARDVAAAPADLGVAARDRPAAARAPPSPAWTRGSPACCASGCSTRPAIRPTGWPTIERVLPQQVDHRGAGRRRRGRHEGAVRTQPADPAGGVRAGAAHRLRQRGQPAAGAGGGAPRPDRRAAGHGGVAPRRSSPRRWSRACCWPWAARWPD